jgi:hypothetical protein
MAQNFPIRAARRIAAVFAECHQARLRSVTLALAPDRQLTNPDKAPDTYAEFLFRTSTPLLHEPAARDRTGRDGTGRDSTGQDGTGRDGTGRDRAA